MIQSGALDAIVIATPHYQHVSLGMEALDAGLRDGGKANCRSQGGCRALDCQGQGKRRLGLPACSSFGWNRYRKIKESNQSGKTHARGLDHDRLVPVGCLLPERGMAGHLEGEERVLLNQCLHQLDAMQWMVGMPSKVNSEVGIGKWHDIEVEDDVSCYMEFPDGASGLFLTSTGETPGSNRLEISGTKGRLLLENDRLVLTRNAVPSDEWCKTSKIGSSNLKQPSKRLISPLRKPSLHLDDEFTDAILKGEKLIAPGEEGLGSGIQRDALLGPFEASELPMDGGAWEEKLNELIAASTHEKKVVELSGDDFSASFRR